MNKYEELAFKNKGIGYAIYYAGVDKYYKAKFDLEKNEMVVNQDENINLTKYQLVVFNDSGVSGLDQVSYQKNGVFTTKKKIGSRDELKNNSLETWQRELDRGIDIFVVDLDFDERTDVIRFSYKNGIVGPIDIKVIYVAANKERYYFKIAQQKKKDLLSKMSVCHRTGISLVNVFWQKADNNVKKIELELFLDNHQLFLKYEMDSEVLFKSIQGLADGSYLYKLSQYDENGNLVVASDMVSFKITSRNVDHHAVVI